MTSSGRGNASAAKRGKRNDRPGAASARTSNLPPARAAALAALGRCLGIAATDTELPPRYGMDAQAALDAVLRARELDPRDAALATELFYGVLRTRTRCEYVFSRFLDRPGTLAPSMGLIFCVATHELLHLDRVPARATVSWAVDAAREASDGRLAGLANAVLRKVAALAETPLPDDFFGATDPSDPAPEILARRYACPHWLVELWLDEYGPETALRYLEAQLQPPAPGLTVRPEHPEAREIAARLAALPALLGSAGLGFAFAPGAHLPELPDAAATHQGFAGREALMALNPDSWPDPVWDACAGRGGKARVLLELHKTVLASDVHRGRLRALERELPGVETREASALDRPDFSARPRTILLDAPCSGLGTLSRRPDIKWKRTEKDLDDLVALQAKMLRNAWNQLPEGGRLAYLTCTLNPDENERQIAAFLVDHHAARLRIEWTTPPDAPWGEFFYAALIDK